MFASSPDFDERRRYLLGYADRLRTARPKRLDAVIAAPDTGRSNPRWTRFVAVGRYRFAYSLIAHLADDLAPAVLASGFVPSILPLRERDLLGMTEDTPFVRRTLLKGVTLYRADAQ